MAYVDDKNSKATTRFHVQTSDVLEDVCVNVSLEGSNQVIWHKERFLDQKEIVENIVHNATNTICWTIHRPLRGQWSIKLRSPTFPPGVFIPLLPVPSSAAYYSEAALSFNSRTNIAMPPSSFKRHHRHRHTDSDASSAHSYPPTPSQSPPPLPNIPPTKNSRNLPEPLVPSSQITQFVLSATERDSGGDDQAAATATITTTTTTTTTTTGGASSSFFARALSAAFKLNGPDRAPSSKSFTLSRVSLQHPQAPRAPRAPSKTHDDGSSSTSGPPSSSSSSSSSYMALLPSRPVLHAPPLLAFHDRTPLLTLRSLSGTIELNRLEERTLGVETSFWIAVALTYLEFLQERESYLAALSD